ncbi:MAG: nucleotidyl transferase AbiEii/AbiGii toxin family protein [Acidimicrobiales bacterium]|nr:nucleotidyl transferase AbiEii/AbiGii toxin family protein [Acidimicrobiales bacterium]
MLSKDFIEFIECCVAREVKFLIVGGYALAAHGHPRATKDLDVWVLIGSDNAERLISAIADFGMEAVGLQPADFMEPDTVIQLGYPPVRIDLLTSASGVDFEDCWARRVAISVGSVAAGFISCEDLIANKRASGRAQDAVDVDVLEGRNTQGH